LEEDFKVERAIYQIEKELNKIKGMEIQQDLITKFIEINNLIRVLIGIVLKILERN